MATANHITMPAGQKGLTRRALLSTLPMAGASLALPVSTAAGLGIFGAEDDAACHPVLALPFVRQASTAERAMGAPPRCFWSVTPSGHYGTDCGTGTRYAHLAIDYMAREGSPNILQWAVIDMIRLGRGHSGVEIGFVAHFARLALAGHAAGITATSGDMA